MMNDSIFFHHCPYSYSPSLNMARGRRGGEKANKKSKPSNKDEATASVINTITSSQKAHSHKRKVSAESGPSIYKRTRRLSTLENANTVESLASMISPTLPISPHPTDPAHGDIEPPFDWKENELPVSFIKECELLAHECYRLMRQLTVFQLL
jgi:hypothetical protein